jgi:exonuclease SbcC
LHGEQGAEQSELARSIADADRFALEATQLEELDEERARREADVAELAEVGFVVERLRGYVRSAGPRIAETKRDRVSRVASAIYGEIMGDASGRLEWGPDYDVILHQRGQQRVFKQLSGGEQMSAALAVRLALLRLFSAQDVAFLDEPTTNMDDTRRANLARQLQGLRGFDQMLVISHDDAFDGLYGRVHHITKVDGATQVEAVP